MSTFLKDARRMSRLPVFRNESRALFRSQGMSGLRESELRQARDFGIAIGIALAAAVVIPFRVWDWLRMTGVL